MKNKNTRTVYGQLCAKMWFSFVELIIVIAIIALISVIWLSINTNYTEKSKNSKITSDIMTIKNSLESYKSENKTLPNPKWNQKFYDNSSNYVHYDDLTAFWVCGNITQDTIPKKYMNYLPIDPRTNQYYAYWKTLQWNSLFEIAWINKTNWNYESKVVWDYTWETGPYNLIREYNWPDFVYDKSKNNFPYNPEKRLITAKIWSFSWLLWSVKVNNVAIDKNWITKNNLIPWDTIEVATWSQAEIYFSDWSKSYLGEPSDNKASKLILANMVYKWENNLFTKIQLALDYGSIWTKTSKLDAESDFEIYTTDTEAAVRGTVFGVKKNFSESYVIVQTWSVEIYKNQSPTNITTIEDKLKANETIPTVSFIYWWPSVTSIIINTWWVRVWSTSVTPLPSPTIPPLPDEDWLSNITPKIKSISSWEVILEFPTSFSWTLNNKEVYTWSTSSPYVDHLLREFKWNLLHLSWAITPNNYNIKVCNQNKDKCTKEISISKTSNIDTACNIWEVSFWDDLWCVEQDKDLVASWFSLVAYAPYDDKDSPNYTHIYFKNFISWNIDTHIVWTTDIKPNAYNFSNDIVCDEINIPNSYCKIWSENWVYIDNNSLSNDSIKYSLSSMNSTWLWTDFAIEMSVRGWALKRPTWNTIYNLLSTDNYLLQTFDWSGNKIKIKQIIGGINISRFLDSEFTVQNLDNNKFYPIIFKKIWVSWNLSINWIATSPITTFSWSLTLWNTLYIWTDSSSNEWNDIINYVKIYKKN